MLNIQGPRINAGLPGVDIRGPRIDAGIDIKGPRISVPTLDIHGPSIGIPKPNLNIHGPKIGGIEIDRINVIKSPKIKMNINSKRKYEISGDKDNILTKIGTDNNWMGAICQNELEKGKENIWKIKILKSQFNCIMVGVAPIDFDINSSIYNYGWYLCCYDSSLFSGEPHNYVHEKTNLKKVNNEITIIMNMKEKTLKFIIDGEDKGESFTNIPTDKPLSPVVLLYNKNDSIEIL